MTINELMKNVSLAGLPKIKELPKDEAFIVNVEDESSQYSAFVAPTLLSLECAMMDADHKELRITGIDRIKILESYSI